MRTIATRNPRIALVDSTGLLVESSVKSRTNRSLYGHSGVFAAQARTPEWPYTRRQFLCALVPLGHAEQDCLNIWPDPTPASRRCMSVGRFPRRHPGADPEPDNI